MVFEGFFVAQKALLRIFYFHPSAKVCDFSIALMDQVAGSLVGTFKVIDHQLRAG